MAADILNRILESKRREVEAMELTYGFPRIESFDLRDTISFKRALADSPTGIIAEFKRRSPSKGDIHPTASVKSVVEGYQDAGAACCSVLTDTPFFGGAPTDLAVARQSVSLPLLRKDFVVSKRQIAEARILGADAVLLIAAALTPEEVAEFTRYAHSLALEVLFEIHNEAEMDRFSPEVDMVGINNRDLATFHTDPLLASRIARQLPTGVVKVAESGLTSIREVRKMRDEGFTGFLIGETFMRADNPGEALRNFING